MKVSRLCSSAFLACALVALAALNASAQEPKSLATPTKKFIPVGSKVYVAPMKDGFDTYVIAGIMKKQVPVVVVTSREKADYEITGIAESDKAGWAKMLFMGSSSSAEQASIKIVEIKSEEVIFGYSVNKGNSVRGKQSAGEACAKHMRESIARN
jgi:hypothetical protein